MGTKITTILLFFFMTACTVTATAAPTETPTIEWKTLPTVTRRVNTAIPTQTRLPPTPTEDKKPITLTGSGDAVVDVDKWYDAALLRVTYSGYSNFAIKNYNAAGDYLDLLVNTIGAYTGTLPIDFAKNEQTTRFAITASGPWTLEILPFSMIRTESIPGVIKGTGDDVIAFSGGKEPDLLKVDAGMASSNFAIWGYGYSRELLVNEIAPYTGTVLSEGCIVIAVTATGPWSIEVTVK